MAENENQIGLFGFAPKWLQKYNSIKSFMIVFTILGTIQAMTWSYFALTMPTMERRFKTTAQAMGVALSGSEISEILFGLILSYYGSSGNRPAYMAVGSFLSALSCFIMYGIHAFYGAGEDAMRLTEEYESLYSPTNNTTDVNKSLTELCQRNISINFTNCQEEVNGSTISEIFPIPLILLFISQFVVGVGTTVFYIFGLTYLDDNSDKVNSPKFLATSLSLRMVGPIVGIGLGYACLELYVDPFLTPVITKADPRWLGAWWLGWVICGGLMALFSILIAIFPKEFKKIDKGTVNGHQEMNLLQETVVSNRIASKDSSRPTLKEMPAATKRILSNMFIVMSLIASVFFLLGQIGYMTFFVKYYEIEFQVSASSGGSVAGLTMLIGSIIGTWCSGQWMSRFKPSANVVLIWDIIVGILFVFESIAYIFIYCHSSSIVFHDNTTLSISNDCNLDCSCNQNKYSPVCDLSTNITYFSACHAGCDTQVLANNSRTFLNCQCLSQLDGVQNQSIVKDGICDSDCLMSFVTILVVGFVIQTLSCTGRISSMILTYRAVEERDKSFMQGITLWVISLFGVIPGPILFGYIFDSTCLVWSEECGKRGNCLIYDKDAVRYWLNGVSICFTCIGVVFDVGVWKYGRNINLYED